jgi:hemolysin type calcium-binding protein
MTSAVTIVARRTPRVAALALALLALAAGSVWAATINGTARNDTLRGGAGADKIFGKGGNDRLLGAGGNDVLVGGPGSDVLAGGPGADTLRCGPGRDTATRDVSDKVASDCEVVRGPKAVPPASPPPQPPAPPAPGAPATYVFGSEVTAEQQARLRDGLDLGARFIRSALGRELPPLTVWAYTDVEALIRVFAETAPTEPANSRDIWARGTVAVGEHRKLWFGPLWFTGGAASNLTKIAVHEAFHVLQYELAGDRSLNSGFEDIPRAGPRWLSEGSAELVGYLAIANAGLTSMSFVRADWAQRAKSSPVTIQRLAVLRGQFEAGSNAWGIMPLAVERLVGEGGTARVLSYYEAIGRGQPWEAAFAAIFGKSIEAFNAEFEAYRRGL